MSKGRSDEIPGEVRSLLAKLCGPPAGIVAPWGWSLGAGGVEVWWEGDGAWSVCREPPSNAGGSTPVPVEVWWRRRRCFSGIALGGWAWRAGWPWGSVSGPWVEARSPCLSKNPQGVGRFPTPTAWCVDAFSTARGNKKVWRRVKAIREAAGVDETPDDCRAFKPGGLSHAFDYYSESQERRALAALLCLVAWRMMEASAGGR